jgi:hypothetical protein
MHSDSTLRFSAEKGFGETLWITCPVCWNAMKVTAWEFAPSEEDCAACRRKERMIGG